MKTVKFKKNWMYRLERYLFSNTLEAKDTCTFRWRLLQIIFSLPLYFTTWVVLRKLSEDYENTAPSAIISKIVSFLFVAGLIFSYLEDSSFTLSPEMERLLLVIIVLFSTLIAALAIGIPAGIIILFSMGVTKIVRSIPKHKVSNALPINTHDNIIKTLYKGAKEKWCSKIEWVDKNK